MVRIAVALVVMACGLDRLDALRRWRKNTGRQGQAALSVTACPNNARYRKAVRRLPVAFRPMDFLDFAKRHPRAARAILRPIVKFRAVVPEALGDPHGWPRMASCANVGTDPRKVRAVAREVYSDLVGLEESHRRIEGGRWEPATSVEQRFPGGGKDLEPFVAEVCRDGVPEEKPFWIVWDRIARELGLAP